MGKAKKDGEIFVTPGFGTAIFGHDDEGNKFQLLKMPEGNQFAYEAFEVSMGDTYKMLRGQQVELYPMPADGSQREDYFMICYLRKKHGQKAEQEEMAAKCGITWGHFRNLYSEWKRKNNLT